MYINGQKDTRTLKDKWKLKKNGWLIMNPNDVLRSNLILLKGMGF